MIKIISSNKENNSESNNNKLQLKTILFSIKFNFTKIVTMTFFIMKKSKFQLFFSSSKLSNIVCISQNKTSIQKSRI